MWWHMHVSETILLLQWSKTCYKIEKNSRGHDHVGKWNNGGFDRLGMKAKSGETMIAYTILVGKRLGKLSDGQRGYGKQQNNQFVGQ
jgi:hypothetical protein